MARLKSHYRKYAAGGAVKASIHTGPETSVAIDSDASPKQIADSLEHDDASHAFAGQIAALRRSEEIQRERQAAQPGLSRHETLAQWQRQGITAAQHDFLKRHDHMVDQPEALKAANAHAVAQGHQVDSPSYFAAIASHFAAAASKPKAKREVMDDEPSMSRASLWSAPVSRDHVPSASGDKSNSRVTLSVEQKSMAKTLGQSEAEYARGLLAMRARDDEYGR
jgi:hypothetical protein